MKFDDDSEWQGRIPEPVERYMAGMADEIKRLRAENERLRVAKADADSVPFAEMIEEAALDATKNEPIENTWEVEEANDRYYGR